MSRLAPVALLFIPLIFGGCAKNPVTGKQELNFVSTHQEIKLGSKNYLYAQQASGGKYTLDPDLNAYVQTVGQKLAKVSDRPDLPFEFVVVNDSIPNAWALPGGKIAINRGLLVNLDNEAELAAVLGHEITHAAARHGAKAMERQIIMTTGLVAANVALAMSDKQGSLPRDALLTSASVAIGLIATKYSRSAELEADAYGMNYMVKAGYDPQAAVSLQQTFVKLMNGKSSHWLEGLFASHPPSQERVKANQERAKTLPANLDFGKERYQQKIALLKKRQPAYDAYDQGVKAFQKHEWKEALRLANEAMQKEPHEALFYGLKGDILAKQSHDDGALKAYDHAIKLDPHYFYYYHQRGLLLKKLKRHQEAQADLKRSQELLPTETAQAALALG